MKISDGWKQALITLLLGTVVTIGATWFTIYDSDRKAQQAELERYKKVRDNIVSIVEEHIVNKEPINIIELKRLIEIQTKTENLSKNIPVMEVLEQAEYNVLNSKHLDFTKKQEYKNTINSIYDLNNKEDSILKRTLSLDSTINLNKYREKENIKSLLVILKQGNEKEINKQLLTVLDSYEASLADCNKSTPDKFDSQITNIIIDNKWTIIIFTSLYIVFAYYYLTLLRTRKRKRVEMKRRLTELEKEREYLITLIVEKKFDDKKASELLKRLQEIDEMILQIREKYNSR